MQNSPSLKEAFDSVQAGQRHQKVDFAAQSNVLSFFARFCGSCVICVPLG